MAGRGLMLAAARMAKTELAQKSEGRNTQEETRRERIGAQPGNGSRRSGPDTSGTHEADPQRNGSVP